MIAIIPHGRGPSTPGRPGQPAKWRVGWQVGGLGVGPRWWRDGCLVWPGARACQLATFFAGAGTHAGGGRRGPV